MPDKDTIIVTGSNGLIGSAVVNFIKPWMIDLADDHYELDITRARTLLDWELKHSLRETLPTMVEALKTDPAGWYRANKLDPPGWLEEMADREKSHAH